jgi:hypothetical protein
MVTKPTLLGALIALGVAMVMGAVIAHFIWRGSPASAGAAASFAEARAQARE